VKIDGKPPLKPVSVGFYPGFRSEPEEGLQHPSVINCGQLTRLEKGMLTDYVGKLSSKKLRELRAALRVALDVD
jgi:mRNA-degrading endonuclease toxin of MazEF toxin-antitoxin module